MYYFAWEVLFVIATAGMVVCVLAESPWVFGGFGRVSV